MSSTRNFFEQFRWITDEASPFKRHLLLFFLMEVAGIICSLLFVVGSKKAIDVAVAHQSNVLYFYLWLIIFSAIAGTVARIYASSINEATRLKLLKQIKHRVIDRQMMGRWETISKWHTGDFALRIQNDCEEVALMISSSGINALLTAIRITAFFALLWVMDNWLALIIVAIIPLLIISKRYFKKMRMLNHQIKRAESSFNVLLTESFRLRLPGRALGINQFRQKKLKESQSHLYDLKIRQRDYAVFSQGLLRLLMNGGYLTAFIWGVFQLQSGDATFGTMAAFLQLVGRIQTPALQLSSFIPQLVRFKTSLDRLKELVDIPQEEAVAVEKLEEIESIYVQNVSFGYDRYKVLKRLTLRFNRGQASAIVGPSGKGKTTLMRLMLGLVRPDQGEIILKTKTQYRHLNIAHRVNFAYVPQGNSLFSGTILENIQAGGEHLAEEQLEHAIKAACAEFIYDLPDGVNTIVGESGHGISEGQAQRIAVARALARNCDIWLFDEVTASLDQKTSNLLTNRIIEYGRDKIIIFITHNLNLSVNFNQIINI